jgi:hypothetical protein
MTPYNDIENNDLYIIREFDDNIDPIELMWHRDDEDRIVEAIGTTDWQVQLDNLLPIALDKPVFIPKHMFHRVIKGNGNLRVKIKKQ